MYPTSFTKHRISRIIHIVVGIGIYFHFKVKIILHFVIYLSMDRHSGCFYLLAMVNSAAVGMGL